MKNLYAALLKAQAEFSPVPKDGANPAFRSRYATLGSVQETAFPILHKHGLVVLQSVRTEWAERGPIVYVGAALVHVESGELTSQELGLVPVKTDPQGIGSAISYGRRYILLTMLGLTADDDDGNAASGAAQMAPQRSAPPPASNGKPPAPPVKPQVWQTWAAPPAAQKWAVEAGHALDSEDARIEFKKLVDLEFGGKLTTGNAAQVYEAYYARMMGRETVRE